MLPNWLQCRREISQGAKLAYARLAQHSGREGNCFPKQKTLADELGVSERMVRDYIRELEKFSLLESVQNGLRMSNNYFFLDHPWIHEGQPGTTANSGPDRQQISAPDRNHIAGHERQRTSGPINKEIHPEKIQEKRIPPIVPPEGDCVQIPSFASSQEEEIYAAYPKQVGKPAALRAILRALDHISFDKLMERTRLFAKTCNSPAQYIPNPATWFREHRFNDDPSTWRRTFATNGKAAPAIIRPEQFRCGIGEL